MVREPFKPVRTLTSCRTRLVYHALTGDPLVWLRQQAQPNDVLFVTQDDGVVWAVPADDQTDWAASSGVTDSGSPVLNSACMWEARLFNTQREILVWRDDGRWQAREITDAAFDDHPEFTECFDEHQLLWGTEGRPEQVQGKTFLLVREGAQGMRHALPAGDGSVSLAQRLCLRVRHYLAPDDVARVVASRLVELTTCKERN